MEEIKHPLVRQWSLWHFTNTKKNWEDNLVELTTFDTVEDYWCLYHHMKLPSELNPGQDYAIFKKGIRPMWEDESNKSGGRLLINPDGLKRNQVDSIWSDLILLLIGESFANTEAINGVVVNVRGKCKLSVWINDKDAIPEIRSKIKAQFDIRLRFESFY